MPGGNEPKLPKGLPNSAKGTNRQGGLFADAKTFRKRADKILEDRPAFVATPKQVVWMNAIMSRMYKFMAIGGGIRGTKTFACLSALVLLCRMFPRSRWAIVRKDLPTLRRNVVPSMEKIRTYAGGFVGPLNMSTWEYTCTNGSKLLLFPEQFIQDPTLERWKGLEVNGFDLEEASELSEMAANKAIERAGSWVVPPTQGDMTPKQPPPLVLVNFNPCANWPRKWFFEPWKAGTIAAPYYFLPATIADNPFASEDYKESLKFLPPEEYRRFVLGEWDFVDDPDQLIKTEWIWEARNVVPVYGMNKIGADIARFGDDKTSVAKISGNALVSLVSIAHFDLMRVASVILNSAAEPQYPVAGVNVHIDAVGLGAGTVDYCRKKHLKVREIVAGAKPLRRPRTMFKFKNLRSQMWWEFREKLRLGQFSFAMKNKAYQDLPIPEKLVGDLASLRYEISGDKVIEVESKKDVKARLGRSPDDGDAVVMASFELPAPIFVAPARSISLRTTRQ